MAAKKTTVAAPKGKTLSKHGRVIGRPTTLTDEIGEKICDLISAGGMLTKVCEEPGMPTRKQVYSWIRHNDAFREAYARARTEWAEFYEEQVIGIAFDESKDTYKDEKGRTFANYAKVSRDKLKSETLRWFMMKWAPKRYGDKTTIESDQPTNVTFTWIAPEATPVPAPAPPLQLEYKPSFADEIDREILVRLVQAIKECVPRRNIDNDPPNETLALIERLIKDALRSYFRDA
jgi:hypothetical protein